MTASLYSIIHRLQQVATECMSIAGDCPELQPIIAELEAFCKQCRDEYAKSPAVATQIRNDYHWDVISKGWPK